jgi:hypothetical protein
MISDHNAKLPATDLTGKVLEIVLEPRRDGLVSVKIQVFFIFYVFLAVGVRDIGDTSHDTTAFSFGNYPKEEILPAIRSRFSGIKWLRGLRGSLFFLCQSNAILFPRRFEIPTVHRAASIREKYYAIEISEIMTPATTKYGFGFCAVRLRRGSTFINEAKVLIVSVAIFSTTIKENSCGPHALRAFALFRFRARIEVEDQEHPWNYFVMVWG